MVENKQQLENETQEWVQKAKKEIASQLNDFLSEFGGNKYTLAIALGLEPETVDGLLNGYDEITLETLTRLLIASNKVLQVMDAKDTPISFGNPDLDDRQTASLDDKYESEIEMLFANGIEDILNMLFPKTDMEVISEPKRKCYYSDEHGEPGIFSKMEDILTDDTIYNLINEFEDSDLTEKAKAIAIGLRYLYQKGEVNREDILLAFEDMDSWLEYTEEENVLDAIESLDAHNIDSITHFLEMAAIVNPDVATRFL